MSTQPKHFVTPEEYLELERKAEYKSEYYNGEIFAMSGVSRRHDRIATQLHFLMAQHLQGKQCDWHSAEMRVLVEPGGLYTYPDLSVTCEEEKYADTEVDTLVNPTLLAEILSPSTEKYDRGKKARAVSVDAISQGTAPDRAGRVRSGVAPAPRGWHLDCAQCRGLGRLHRTRVDWLHPPASRIVREGYSIIPSFLPTF